MSSSQKPETANLSSPTTSSPTETAMRFLPLTTFHKLLILIICTIVAVETHVVEGVSQAEQEYTNSKTTCSNEHECSASYEQQRVHKNSKHCPSSQSTIESTTCLLQHAYDAGKSAQAYKPNAPLKKNVCETQGKRANRLARNFIWRSSKQESMTISIRGNVYTCAENLSVKSNMTIEVWQPRPDGTYSSLREGVEEGDCRATLLVNDADSIPEVSNMLGRVHFETLAPGSSGLLGGLVPSSTHGEYIYGPGKIHVLINTAGHYPLFEEISMSDIEGVLSNDYGARSNNVHFFGPDLRPHVSVAAKINKKHSFGGMELQSSRIVDSKLEVEVDFFLAPMPKEHSVELKATQVFCSAGGWVGSFASFFKEPISVCYRSMLDYFAV